MYLIFYTKDIWPIYKGVESVYLIDMVYNSVLLRSLDVFRQSNAIFTFLVASIESRDP